MFNHDLKKSKGRIIVAVDPPYWTQEQQDTFAAGPLASVAWASSWISGPPDVSGNALNIRSYGVPLFEWVKARETYAWLPLNPLHPFAMEIPFVFNQADPVYTVPFIVPGADNDLGDLDDPLLVYQLGSATPDSTQGALGSGDEGDIFIISNGSQVIQMANDFATHTARIEWDPLKQDNAFIFTLKIDGTTEYESDTASWPRHPQFGWTWDVLHEYDPILTAEPIPIPAIGTGASPLTVLSISNFKTTQLGALGYEDPVVPDFALDGSGDPADHDLAEPGEIHTVDLVRWAIIPEDVVISCSGDSGRNVQMNKATVILNPDAVTNIQVFPWNNRAILIDVLEETPVGTTEYRRKMAGFIVHSYSQIDAGQRQLVLEINSQPEDILMINVTRAWRGDAAPADNPVLIGGMFVGDIIDDCLDLAAALKGSPLWLGQIDRVVRDLDLLVSDAGTLGASLLSFVAAILETCGYEYVVHYTTSGTGRYGLFKSHAGVLGTGTPDYVLTSGDVVSFNPDDNRDNGPGQVSLRQSFPDVIEDTLISTFHQPTPGTFPTVVYPITGKVLSDSISFVKELQATGLYTLKDKDNVNVTGGIAQHRYRLMNAQRRTAQAVVQGREHIEPIDEIEFDVEGALPNETWIVDKESWSLKDGKYESNLSLVTTDWHQAIRRGL